MAHRFYSTILIACLIILANLAPISAQMTGEPAKPYQEKSLPQINTQQENKPSQEIKPTQEDLNTPSGDASTARQIILTQKPNITIKGDALWDNGYTALLNAFKTLRNEAKRLNLSTVGSPQATFTHTDDTGFKFEAFLILEKDPTESIKPLNKMAFSTSPSGKAFVFQHIGAYDDIDSTYEAITAWLDEKNLASKGAFVEEYLNEPEGSDDALLKLNIYVFIE